MSLNIKQILRELKITPNKRLGQNFLMNEGIYKRLIDAVEPVAGDTIVEVGPGLGTLTEYLAQTNTNILAIEKDAKLAQYLTEKYESQNRVTIIKDDILEFDPAKYGLKTDKYKIVGNIPYYLTTRLLRIVFSSWPRPQSIVLMMQREVSQKIVAKPPNMSLLATAVQYYTVPQIIMRVSRGSFYPAPDVDSAIIKLIPHKNDIIDKEYDSLFFKVVTAGFGQKRRQLLNTLSAGLGIPKETVQTALEKTGIDPKERAQNLTINQWHDTTKAFYSRLQVE
ncbi:MAG: 16S rRNA (adenine(1518)-N(6)/adenine(1519)-N(6))-dimethyltransferase RsmA [Parcubacteria group bacterium]